MGFQFGVNLPSLDRPSMDWSFLAPLGAGFGRALDGFLGTGPRAASRETAYEAEAGRLRARKEYGVPLDGRRSGSGGGGRAGAEMVYVDEGGRVTQAPIPGVEYDDGPDEAPAGHADHGDAGGDCPDGTCSLRRGGGVSLSPFAPMASEDARLVSDARAAPRAPGMGYPDPQAEAARLARYADETEGRIRGLRVPASQVVTARRLFSDMREEAERARTAAYERQRQAPLDENTVLNGRTDRARTLFDLEARAADRDREATERARLRNDRIGMLTEDRVNRSGFDFGKPILGAAPTPAPLFPGAVVPGAIDPQAMVNRAADPYRNLADETLKDRTEMLTRGQKDAADVKKSEATAFATESGRRKAALLFEKPKADDEAKATQILDAVEKAGVDVTALRGMPSDVIVKNSSQLLSRAAVEGRGDRAPAFDALYRTASKRADDMLEELGVRLGAVKFDGAYQRPSDDPAKAAEWDAGIEAINAVRRQAAGFYAEYVKMARPTAAPAPAGTSGAKPARSAFRDALREMADEYGR